MDDGDDCSNDQSENVRCEENYFTHKENNEYTYSKNIGSTAILFSSALAFHQSSEVTVKTDDEIYQHPILRKKGMNDMMLRDQFCAAGKKYRYILCYNVSEEE